MGDFAAGEPANGLKLYQRSISTSRMHEPLICISAVYVWHFP